MLMDDVTVAVTALDVLARQLRGSRHSTQVAILRAQLLNLAREVESRPTPKPENGKAGEGVLTKEGGS